MNQVRCPHCRYALVDDGQLAQQVVTCSQCQGQFRMPDHAELPAVQALPHQGPSPSTDSSYRSATRQHTRRKDPTVFVVCGLLGLVLAGAGIAFVALNREDSPTAREVSKKPVDDRGDKTSTNEPGVSLSIQQTEHDLEADARNLADDALAAATEGYSGEMFQNRRDDVVYAGLWYGTLDNLMVGRMLQTYELKDYVRKLAPNKWKFQANGEYTRLESGERGRVTLTIECTYENGKWKVFVQGL